MDEPPGSVGEPFTGTQSKRTGIRISVIVELSLPADEFELGRILEVSDDASIVLETMVPMSERAVPFFRLFDGARSSFEDAVRDHQAVVDVHVVSSHDDETLALAAVRTGRPIPLLGDSKVSLSTRLVVYPRGSCQ